MDPATSDKAPGWKCDLTGNHDKKKMVKLHLLTILNYIKGFLFLDYSHNGRVVFNQFEVFHLF